MTTNGTAPSLSRRTALTGLGAGSLGLALAATRQAAAQDGSPASYAEHPNVGVWMIESPIGRAIAVYSADGSIVTAPAASQAGPQGVMYSSAQVGTWEPTGERGTHLTAVQLLSDGSGAYTGSVTVDAFQEVSDNGQTFESGEGSSITIRDANDNILQVITDAQPAVGTRMGVGAPGLPEGTPTVGTPTG
jgi:hypothetical protein